jgi:putative membrane protein
MPVGSHTTRALLFCGVVFVPGLVLGCGKGSGSDNANATDTTKPASATPTTGTTTPTPAAEIAPNPEIASWNDNDIVARLVAGDKAEVKLGRLAESKAIIPAVKDFAKMIVADHSKSEKDVAALQSSAKLSPSTAGKDTGTKASDDIVQRLTTMPKGTDWDSTFVRHVFEEHQHDIADAKAMQNQAKDAQLKALLGNTLPVLQKHLDSARTLLGETPGGTAAWRNQEFRKTERPKDSTKKK